jgi:hypothetical protein
MEFEFTEIEETCSGDMIETNRWGPCAVKGMKWGHCWDTVSVSLSNFYFYQWTVVPVILFLSNVLGYLFILGASFSNYSLVPIDEYW